MIIEHLLIAAQLVTAAVKGDVATPDAKEKEWIVMLTTLQYF